MAIELPHSCPRNIPTCSPLSQIVSDDGISFICVGMHRGNPREPGDVYRECIRARPGVDHMCDCDRRDLTDLASVVTGALSVLANMEENGEGPFVDPSG